MRAPMGDHTPAPGERAKGFGLLRPLRAVQGVDFQTGRKEARQMTAKIAVWLIWLATLGNGARLEEKAYPMADMEACLKAVEKAQVKVPSGGDAETTVSLFCANRKMP